LIDSATRLYGDEMNRLWGEIAPVPTANLVTLAGGERIESGGRTFEVAYTPGHAVHHVSYFDRESGLAFVGDTAGVCIDGGYVLPPTPPPDIDVDKWRGSLDQIEAWSPDTIFLTHFGPIGQVRPHLETLWHNLQEMATWVRRTLEEPGSDEDRSRTFADGLRHDMRRQMNEVQIAAYPVAAPFELLWLGLAVHTIRIVAARGLDETADAYRTGYLIAGAGAMFILCTVHIWGGTLVFVMFYIGAGSWFYTGEVAVAAPKPEWQPARRRPARP